MKSGKITEAVKTQITAPWIHHGYTRCVVEYLINGFWKYQSFCHQGRPLVGFPWSKPSTQTTIGSLFNMVPVGLKPSTRLLSLIGYLGVVSWSIGKAGGRSRDGLRSHRVKDMLVTYI